MSQDKSQESVPLIRPLPTDSEVPLADLGPLIELIKAITTLIQAPDALALHGILSAISIANIRTIRRRCTLRSC